MAAAPNARAAAPNARAGAGTEAAWTPRTLLVTGAAGFIGSHVVARSMTGPLSRTLGKVVALDRLDYCSAQPDPAEFTLGGGARQPHFVFVRADVTRLDDMVALLAEHDVDAVVHLAALTHVDNSFGDNLHFTHDNVVGTHVLLEACRRSGWRVRRFLHVSTDEVYGESRPERPFVESDALDPRNPYAATKAAAEAIVRSYFHSFRAPVVIARPNNVYGPRQFPEKVVPKFCRQLQRGLPLTVHGDGSARRCFIFATDCADALLDFCLLRGAVGEAYNVGGSHTLSVNELADELAAVFAEVAQARPAAVAAVAAVAGVAAPPPQAQPARAATATAAARVVHVEDRFANDRSYDLSSAKLRALGWPGPPTPWARGVRDTVAWYQAHPVFWDNEDAAIVAHPRLVSLAAGGAGGAGGAGCGRGRAAAPAPALRRDGGDAAL